MKYKLLLLLLSIAFAMDAQPTKKCHVRLYTSPNPSHEWKEYGTMEVSFYSGETINNQFKDSTGFVPVPISTVYVSFIGTSGHAIYIPLDNIQCKGLMFIEEDIKGMNKLIGKGLYDSRWELTIIE